MSRAMQPYGFFIGVSSINVCREANPGLQSCGTVIRENGQSMMMGREAWSCQEESFYSSGSSVEDLRNEPTCTAVRGGRDVYAEKMEYRRSQHGAAPSLSLIHI